MGDSIMQLTWTLEENYGGGWVGQGWNLFRLAET